MGKAHINGVVWYRALDTGYDDYWLFQAPEEQQRSAARAEALINDARSHWERQRKAPPMNGRSHDNS